MKTDQAGNLDVSGGGTPEMDDDLLASAGHEEAMRGEGVVDGSKPANYGAAGMKGLGQPR